MPPQSQRAQSTVRAALQVLGERLGVPNRFEARRGQATPSARAHRRLTEFGRFVLLQTHHVRAQAGAFVRSGCALLKSASS